MTPFRTRKAFTLIELIFVIVILGIVASLGAEMIARVYESYIIQRAVHRGSVKSELAINELANRLNRRIDLSILARKPGYTGLSDNDAYPLIELPIDKVNQYTALEWIGYDGDGFNSNFTASNLPGWSGFCDLNASTYNTLVSPASKLGEEKNIMKVYTGTNDGNGSAIIFLGDSEYRTDGATYEAKCMYRQDGCIFPVTVTNDTTLTFVSGDGNRSAGIMKYTEFYQLASSAFAVVPENNRTIETADGNVTLWDLRLYYGYQPWQGENYTNGSSSLLLRNVSVFRFKKEINALRLKICVSEQIAASGHKLISICKEKEVIR
ncbi:type II secretion system protein [Nitratifractor sp.]